jgi:hypothetical protein
MAATTGVTTAMADATITVTTTGATTDAMTAEAVATAMTGADERGAKSEEAAVSHRQPILSPAPARPHARTPALDTLISTRVASATRPIFKTALPPVFGRQSRLAWALSFSPRLGRAFITEGAALVFSLCLLTQEFFP